jgi:hypothetical protein
MHAQTITTGGVVTEKKLIWNRLENRPKEMRRAASD